MEEQTITLKVEEVSQEEEISQAEEDFFSKYCVDCRDKDNIVGVICKEEGYNLLVEKVGYEGFCECFLGKKFTCKETLNIWSKSRLVNP